MRKYLFLRLILFHCLDVHQVSHCSSRHYSLQAWLHYPRHTHKVEK